MIIRNNRTYLYFNNYVNREYINLHVISFSHKLFKHIDGACMSCTYYNNEDCFRMCHADEILLSICTVGDEC